MAKMRTNAQWAQEEIFLVLGDFMNLGTSEEDVIKLHHRISGWMVFARNDNLLSTYLKACEDRLPLLSKKGQQACCKDLLSCAKNYSNSKEYEELLKLAQKLIK